MTLEDQIILIEELIREDDQSTVGDFVSLLTEILNIEKASENEN